MRCNYELYISVKHLFYHIVQFEIQFIFYSKCTKNQRHHVVWVSENLIEFSKHDLFAAG